MIPKRQICIMYIYIYIWVFIFNYLSIDFLSFNYRYAAFHLIFNISNKLIWVSKFSPQEQWIGNLKCLHSFVCWIASPCLLMLLKKKVNWYFLVIRPLLNVISTAYDDIKINIPPNLLLVVFTSYWQVFFLYIVSVNYWQATVIINIFISCFGTEYFSYKTRHRINISPCILWCYY